MTVMAPPVLDSTPDDGDVQICRLVTQASPVRVALGHYYLHDIKSSTLLDTTGVIILDSNNTTHLNATGHREYCNDLK